MMALCYKKDFDAAFGISDKLFQTHLNVPTFWNQVATCHLLKGNERKALLFYNKALEVKANYVPALNNIAVIYNKNGQDQKAQVALQRALSKGVFAKTPRYNLAFLMLEYGLATKSLPLFKSLSEDTPGDIELRVGLANSYALMERWSEAWEQFSAIPDSRRKNPDVGLNMALVAHKLGKKDFAKNILSATAVNSSAKKYAERLSEVIGE
jgi:Flp pilus assembly protein TadD